MCVPLFGLAETTGQFAIAIAAEGFGFAARAGITEQPSSKTHSDLAHAGFSSP
jgi:hypothetical protein